MRETCPVCGRRLEVRIVGGMEVRACPEGHGILVREHEMVQILIYFNHDPLVSLPPVPPPRHPCPVCGYPLRAQNIGGVTLWKCHRCGWIWLERHRFSQMVQVFRQFLP